MGITEFTTALDLAQRLFRKRTQHLTPEAAWEVGTQFKADFLASAPRDSAERRRIAEATLLVVQAYANKRTLANNYAGEQWYPQKLREQMGLWSNDPWGYAATSLQLIAAWEYRSLDASQPDVAMWKNRMMYIIDSFAVVVDEEDKKDGRAGAVDTSQRKMLLTGAVAVAAIGGIWWVTK